jgi:hypothetical protein
MRRRGGPTVPIITTREAEAVPVIRRRVATGSTVHADAAAAWGTTCMHGTKCGGSTTGAPTVLTHI